MTSRSAEGGVGGRLFSRFLLTGFAVGSTGGPLALVSLVPAAAGRGVASVGLVTLVGELLFVFPLLVWFRYSEQIASAGGLYRFAEAAMGTRIARIQGVLWVFSYALYLAYTVTFIVYDQLPVVLPGTVRLRPSLEVVLPLVFCGMAMLRIETILRGFLAGAAAQIAVMVALGVVFVGHLGSPLHSFWPAGGVGGVATGGANVSLLFVCASLPLFLGSEAFGAGPGLRLALVVSFGVVSVVLLFAVFPLVQSGGGGEYGLAGFRLASQAGPHWFAFVVGLATIASSAMLILAEFVALGRLLHVVVGRPLRWTLARVSIVFVALDMISLADPERFYRDLLAPSLDALFLAHLVVFVGYPRFRHRIGRLGALDIAAATVASSLMAYGLYVSLQGQLAS